MAHQTDLYMDKYQSGWTAVGNDTAAQLTVTKAATAGRGHAVTKVDASYSVATVSGLLVVSAGSTVIGKKYIHGSGAIDFSADAGYLAAVNTAVSAVLDSGGGGVVGTITISGFTTYSE